jgi:cyclase
VHEGPRVGQAPMMTAVASNVFAYVQPDGGWCLSNAAVIRDGGHVALVDTAATEARARLLREHVARVAPSPPAYLINTHFHGDHTFGNYLFVPDAVVIAQERTREYVMLSGLHMTGLWPEVDWGNVTVEPPAALFRDRMTLYVGDTRVELIDVAPAHTASDTVVWLPGERVLITGDVAMSGVTPFCPMGSVAGSLAALDRLRELDPAVVITGHGPVAGPGVLDEVEGYLRWLQDLARRGMAAGLSPLEAAQEADLGEYADWLEAERLVPNLHRAYADERAVPPASGVDLAATHEEMVTYRGGRLVCRA